MKFSLVSIPSPSTLVNNTELEKKSRVDSSARPNIECSARADLGGYVLGVVFVSKKFSIYNIPKNPATTAISTQSKRQEIKKVNTR